MRTINLQWLKANTSRYTGMLPSGEKDGLIVRSSVHKIRDFEYHGSIVTRGDHLHSDENPYELLAMNYLSQNVKGTVLVVGAGSGALLKMLEENDQVSRIDVYEEDSTLRDLMESFFPEINFIQVLGSGYNHVVLNIHPIIEVGESIIYTDRSKYLNRGAKVTDLYSAISMIT